jgi:hypothetical protein
MNDFHRIITSAPINAEAARQTAQGEAYTPTVTIQDYFADMPRLKTPEELNQSAKRNPEWRDFTGMVFGRLTVMGVMAKDSNEHASWVCRCKCGGFCTRKSKSLKVAERGGNSFVDRCGMCDYTDKLRTGWKFKKPMEHRLKSAGRVVISKGKWE